MKRRTRAAAKERRADRLAQAKADAEVRKEWLATVYGSPETLRHVASTTEYGHSIRVQILEADETPDGITHAMLRAAARAKLA